MEFTVYLAAKGFVKELVYELGDAIEVADRLVFAPGPPRPAAWAQNIWLNPRRIPIESIGDAASKLRALQRNWSLFSVRQHRRAKLIEEKLPAVRPKPVEIGTAPPTAPLGAWTLLDKDVIVASPACSSPFPHGEVLFVENKQDPPSRAYLKLWELFTLLGQAPSPGSFCLDLGGSPGGWAWVLASLGCKVLSVDKALLDPRVEAMPNVEFRQLSAFALDPREVGVVDWLFCDVICYPDRLWRLVDRWRTFGRVKNFVCTVKFQGATDHETAAKFASWPGARLVHLFNNKHELTWVLLDQKVDEDSAPVTGPRFFALRQDVRAPGDEDGAEAGAAVAAAVAAEMADVAAAMAEAADVAAEGETDQLLKTAEALRPADRTPESQENGADRETAAPAPTDEETQAAAPDAGEFAVAFGAPDWTGEVEAAGPGDETGPVEAPDANVEAGEQNEAAVPEDRHPSERADDKGESVEPHVSAELDAPAESQEPSTPGETEPAGEGTDTADSERPTDSDNTANPDKAEDADKPKDADKPE